MSKTTRKKILTVIKELNYEPNLIARSLATREKNMFAVLIPYHTEDNTYWKTPLEGIEKAETEIRDYGVRLVKFLFDQYNIDSFKKESKKVFKIAPNAVLLAPVFYKESLIFIKKCDSANIPYLFIDSNLNNQKNISYIGQDSFQSGYLAARLIRYGLTGKLNFLVIHVARKTENTNHLKQREEGFRFFFKNNSRFRNTRIKHIFIPGSEKDVAFRIPLSCFGEKTDGVFVTSNAHKVAGFMVKNNLSETRFIGYDLTPDNLKFLEEGIIDFLICQKPFEQGYQGILSLFNHFVLRKPVKYINYVPIDIITRENYRYYMDYF